MRLFKVVVLVLATLHGSSAFTTKKRDTKRPAFQVLPANGVSVKEQQQGAARMEDSAQAHPAPAFAFAGQMVPVKVVEAEDDVAVGYATGLVACVVSLALGFSLGYGTL